MLQNLTSKNSGTREGRGHGPTSADVHLDVHTSKSTSLECADSLSNVQRTSADLCIYVLIIDWDHLCCALDIKGLPAHKAQLDLQRLQAAARSPPSCGEDLQPSEGVDVGDCGETGLSCRKRRRTPSVSGDLPVAPGDRSSQLWRAEWTL